MTKYIKLQYFGDAIICMYDDDKIQGLAKQYCWLHGANHISEDNQKHLTGGSCTPSCEDNDDSCEDKTPDKTDYYIWVIPFLIFQATIFMIPHFIWKMAEGGLVKDFNTSEAKSATIVSGQSVTYRLPHAPICR